jgi:alpha-methylacyl-CoA racemase
MPDSGLKSVAVGIDDSCQSADRASASGPLKGVRAIEFAGIGPGPFCGQLLSDAGADIVRIDRVSSAEANLTEVTKRGRRSLALNLKDPRAVEVCLSLVDRADILFEGYRPGVMERLGLGPEIVLERNPKIVYGRMTGWGQTGPIADAAGHDINYIAISGALHAIGTPEKPLPPLNLVGDFGGGALYLAFGMLAALHHARVSGKGQVVDAAMSEGAASLMSFFYGLRADGQMTEIRSDNRLDGGAHFYNTYKCSDEKWIAVGSFEPEFYEILLERTGFADDPDFRQQMNKKIWPKLKDKLAAVFASKTRSEWCAIFEGSDACFAPIMDLSEAPHHRQNLARQAFVEIEGVVQPAPTPRFSLTPGRVQCPPVRPGADSERALRDWGISAEQVEKLKLDGVI